MQPVTIPFNPIIIKPILINKVTVIIIRHFVLFVIPLPATKSSRLSLYSFVFLNQLSSLSEDLAKQKAASIKKGNAGNIGTMAPTAPKPTLAQPRIMYRIFSFTNLHLFLFFFTFYHMVYCHNRMIENHSRARKTHNFTNFLPHIFFITMNFAV